MRAFFFFVFLTGSCLGFCSIPSDEEVIYGKFENGLTYYIRENSFPNQKAALRLVVKVGSIYEEDDEKGIAHFIEHLVFRGTKHFEDGEIFQYLESIGCWTGADANAYTTYDHTLYQLDIPLDKDQSLETALTILEDIASGATLTNDSIEKERNVVLDELYHDISSPSSKFSEKLIHSFIPDSPYPDHAPIGLEKVIQTVSPDTLRAFYKRWYRPDRMALIAVGDFESASIKQKIEKYFSTLPCPEESVIEPSMEIQYSESPQTIIYYDPDLLATQIALISFYPSEQNESASEDQIKRNFLSSICMQMLQHRLAKLEAEGTTFLGTDAETGSFIGKTNYSYIQGQLLETSYQEGLKLINQELQTVLKYGFTKSEWENIHTSLKGRFKRSAANADKTEHQAYLHDYISHFLKNIPLISSDWYSDFIVSLVDTLTIEEINAFLPSSHLADSFNIFFATSSEEIQSSLENDILQGFFNSENTLLSAREESQTISFQSFPKFPKGTISSVYKDDLVNRWSLSNGIELVLKETDLEQERIYIFAHAKGGLAGLPEEYVDSASIALEYAVFSGLNGLTHYELSEFLKSHGIIFRLKLKAGLRTLHLSVDKDKIELLFQLLHEFFTNHPFNRNEWDILTAKKDELIKADLKDSGFLFDNFVSQVNSQNHFYFQPVDCKKADEAMARRMFDYFFGSAQDFTFVVVGDFDKEKIADLTEEYLASLPAKKKEPIPPTVTPCHFPEDVIYKEFKHGHQAYTTTVISLPYDYDTLHEESESTYSFYALTKILEQRLQTALRKKLGTTYGVSVSYSEPFYPDFQHSHLQIEFTSQSTHRKKMIDLILQEMAALQSSPPTEQEVTTVKALFLESKKQEAFSNRFWINALHFSLIKNLPLGHIISYEKHIADLSPEKIQKAAQMVFSHPYYTVISHLPEE